MATACFACLKKKKKKKARARERDKGRCSGGGWRVFVASAVSTRDYTQIRKQIQGRRWRFVRCETGAGGRASFYSMRGGRTTTDGGGAPCSILCPLSCLRGSTAINDQQEKTRANTTGADVRASARQTLRQAGRQPSETQVAVGVEVPS